MAQSLQDMILADSRSQYSGKSLEQFGASNRPSLPGGLPDTAANRTTTPTPQPTNNAPTPGGVGWQAFLDSGGLDSVLQGQPQQPQIDFDALIRPALEGLEAAIGPLTQSTENRVGEIQQGAITATQGAQQSFGAQQQQLDTAKTGAQQQGQSAADEARRQYSEIAQGQQARYGGSTGTGRFANEILGSQTTRNISQVRKQVTDAVLQIDQKKQQVEEIGRIALQDIQDKATSQVQQARDNLDLQLADIRKQKGELQARKAELAANAIQIYQNQVESVKQSNAQFLQGLFVQQQKATQQLELAKQKAAQKAQEVPELNFSTLNEGQSLVGYDKTTGEASNLYTAPTSLEGGGTEFDSLLSDLGLSGQTTENNQQSLTPGLNSIGAGRGF